MSQFHGILFGYFPFSESIIFMEKFREIDLFDFTSFLGLDFTKFSGPLCEIVTRKIDSHIV